MQYLNSFERVRPGIIAMVCGLFIQVGLSYYFVLDLQMGLLGSGLAVSVSNICQSVFLFSVLFYYEEMREAMFWPTFDARQWEYVKEFLVIGIPSMFIACLEIGGVEIM